MSKELIVESANNLKKALPLMMKYSVPTTPNNYALWYHYVAEKNPALKESMDKLLSASDICPPIQAESLYREHVCSATENETWEFRSTLENMMTQLDQLIGDTHSDTTDFQHSFDKNVSNISKVEEEGWSIEEVVGLLKSLEKDAKQMRNATQFFGNSLASAKNEIGTLKTQLEESRKAALYDSLTGLLNRHAFDTELTSYLQSNSGSFSIILCDIDHFKQFNDTWGHLLGDQVLKAVGRKINESMREQSTAYRFGGEEFVMLLPKTNIRIARHFAESIRKKLEKLSLKDKRSGQMINNITASFGVVESQPNESITEVIARADEYLYKAKNLGRNRVLPI
ncbi:GGDEF domain-containing protein [Psychromonas sp. GE-S-Ul-11]|uniref:GGDEF domain-containing protein n=1 Tax=unclassified Psychromonas TaxID=2614957 RepID=UPI00390C47B0